MTLSAHHRTVEVEREKLGYWGQSPDAPRYSICVSNYNMSDTLERAMGSVLRQLDPKLYEVIVIDDGSSDDSVEVLKKLAAEYPHFRFIPLPRESNRKLGENRNISIRAARGEYVLIHIDADDEWEPYLPDFVTLFHKVEEAAVKDILLVGQQTGMAKRDFLLGYGPYDNIYRCEDRNMMMKIAKDDRLLFMDYRVYRTRLSRPKKKKFIKICRDMGSHLVYEMRQNEPNKPKQIWDVLIAPIVGGPSPMTTRLIRAALVLPIYIYTRFLPPIINQMTWQQLRDYHANKRGTYAEIMARMGKSGDLCFLNEKARAIFEQGIKKQGFTSSE